MPEYIYKIDDDESDESETFIGFIRKHSPKLVRCKDCKHKPKRIGKNSIEFPDEICPCQCDDGWYNWIPNDNWFCANGETK